MDKVSIWRNKVNEYYINTSINKIKQDLESAGFNVMHLDDNFSEFRSAYPSMFEVAASFEIDDSEDDQDIIIAHKAKVVSS